MQSTNDHLKGKLLHKKELLLTDLKRPDLSNNKCSLLDSIDQALVFVNRANECAIHSHKINQLQKIEVALERVQSKILNQCVDCEKDITERLEVLPEAIRCVYCQTLFENATEPDGSPRI